jgi:hypothetical protein
VLAGGVTFSVRTVLFVSLAWYAPKGAPFHCNCFLLSVWNVTVVPLQVLRYAMFNVRKVGVIGVRFTHRPLYPQTAPGTH